MVAPVNFRRYHLHSRSWHKISWAGWYCIKRQNSADISKDVAQIGHTYENATAAVILATCSNSDVGICGVSLVPQKVNLC